MGWLMNISFTTLHVVLKGHFARGCVESKRDFTYSVRIRTPGGVVNLHKFPRQKKTLTGSRYD